MADYTICVTVSVAQAMNLSNLQSVGLPLAQAFCRGKSMGMISTPDLPPHSHTFLHEFNSLSTLDLMSPGEGKIVHAGQRV